MTKKQGYNRIAFLYDFVAAFFSFNQINKSQLPFLERLSDKSSCLILGGGTGYFLQQLLQVHPTIQVTYVEGSAKMMDAAQQRIQKEIPDALDRITFVCKNVEDFEWQQYDAIVCNYFLDIFDDSYVQALAEKFKQHLNPQGVVYITDFHVQEANGLVRWSTVLGLKVLYYIHKRITHMQAVKLPEIEKIMQENSFIVMYSKYYLKGILKCSVYQKSG